MTRILVCVLSCQKNKAIWPTILDRIKNNNDIIIFCGGSETTQFNESDKILYLNCNDFYEGLPEKMLFMIEHVLTLECFKDVTHILKIDDHDIDLISDESLAKLSNRDELWKHDYIGHQLREVPGSGYGGCHFGKVSKGCYWDSKFYTGPFTSWLDGGHTYILSRTALQIINMKWNVRIQADLDRIRVSEIYEDVMIAAILADYSIKPYTLLYLK